MKNDDGNPDAISRRKFIEKAAIISALTIIPAMDFGCRKSQKLTNIGFIGTGKQAMDLKKFFLDTGEVNIAAAADVYGGKLKRFVGEVDQHYADQRDYPGCTAYTDFRELLKRKDIQAVVIAVPDHWHSVMAILAARAGKDIYCEKPLSLTIAEGRAMVTEARKHKVVFQTGSMQRSWPEFRQAVELVRNGYIGEIKTVKVNVGGPPMPYNLTAEPVPGDLDWDFWLGPNTPQVYNHNLAPGLKDDFWAHWRSYREFGGGFMTDWGAHMFDIAQWALDMDDSGPVLITPPDRDHPFLTYQYASGITMTHEPLKDTNGVRFIGTKGEIYVMRGKLETTPAELKDHFIGEKEKQVYHSDNHYKDFLQAMRTRIEPIADVEIGHRTATVCNLGNIAYQLNRPLHWDPVKEAFAGDDQANQLRTRAMRKEWMV